MLCDHAHQYEGKISILGGCVSIFNATDVPGFAIVTFVGRIGLEDSDRHPDHHMQIRILNHVNAVVADLQAPIHVDIDGTTFFDGVMSGINIIQPLPVPFTDVGVHWVEFHFDHVLRASLPLLVQRINPVQ